MDKLDDADDRKEFQVEMWKVINAYNNKLSLLTIVGALQHMSTYMSVTQTQMEQLMRKLVDDPEMLKVFEKLSDKIEARLDKQEDLNEK